MGNSSLAIKLSKSAETAVKKGHPWIFEKSIIKGPANNPQAGSLCVLFDRSNNRPYAFGLWDPEEIIRIKVIAHDSKLQLSETYWIEKLEVAKEKRKLLLQYVTGYRAIHGENDGFPGLILDIYDKVGVLKVYSKIWKPYLETLTQAIPSIFQVESIVFRLNRKLEGSKEFAYQQGQVIGKKLSNERIPFSEYGVKFYAYPISGHKTGFFLDQRPNRYWVQQHAKEKTILDVFSYVGGFGIHGLKGGAKSLTSMDISAQAMDVAKENLLLNQLKIEKWHPLVGDAFKELENLIQSRTVFDIVVIDPPSFAKQNSEVEVALKQYQRLAELGAKLTRKGGYLLLGSCSSRITLEDFKISHELAFQQTNTHWKIVNEILHDVDHPITYLEGIYLKTITYQKS
ncbi:MAG: class I SAM-dependent rRNA methyltransferase [Brumimicrobium sp.]|nr:class I SAM-dependent rRNA methyltransferase [Brumimicrobium sp.]